MLGGLRAVISNSIPVAVEYGINAGTPLATPLGLQMFNGSLMLAEWSGFVYYLGNGSRSGSKTWSSSSGLGELICVKIK